MSASRRDSLRLIATGVAGLGLGRVGLGAAEPPPETTRLRLSRVPSACVAPQYVARTLLQAEGFQDVQYVGEGTSQSGLPGARAMGAGETDIATNLAAPLVPALDAGVPIDPRRDDPRFVHQAIAELPYGRWRDLDPEETVRFYALRLREAQMVKSAPKRLIAQGTDWRFLEQLRREMKT